MSDAAIRVADLSKCYRIGAAQERHTMLREAVAARLSGRGPARDKNMIWALKDVSFQVQRGEAVGVIGRNGAGKSTLLKILSRITEPTSGRAEIRGRVGSLLEVGTGFHPELTGRENIYLNGAILGMKRTEISARFAEIVAFAEVERFLDTPVKRYSSGMYVRLAFAVAAHLEPEILLVDEVLAVGDNEFQKRCLGKMEGVANQGRTVFLVSHNLVAVENLCRRTLYFDRGMLVGAGDTSAVVRSYLESQQVQPFAAELERGGRSETVTTISVLDENGDPLPFARTGHDLLLGIDLKLDRRLSDAVVMIGLNTATGARVAALHSGMTGKRLCLAGGKNRVTCFIPANPLLPGSYLLDASVFLGNEVVCREPAIGALRVEPGDFYGSGRLPDVSWGGNFALRQEWAVGDEPSEAPERANPETVRQPRGTKARR